MNVALGVGGGIAAYKAAELARALMKKGAAVNTVMTRSAEEFIQPLTFAALTGRKVITSLFASGSAEDTLSSAIEHIRVAQENDVLVVAPATADLMAKFAHGLADDFLSTLYLAFTGPVVIAPAMNSNMWNHTATQANLAVLLARGHTIVQPGDGELACGMVGPGRLAEPEAIADAVMRAVSPKRDLESETLLITAGPTQEPLDAVRYLSNRSSGKMGFAIAQEAAKRGARVILVSGPVSIPDPHGVAVEHVRTAAEMLAAVMKHLDEATIIVKAAAVADYYRADAPHHKVKKTAARMSIELSPTVDILAELGRRKGDRLLIGFAAETGDLVAEARRKLASKNCDMIVGNLVSQEGIGFDANENEVVLVRPDSDPVKIPRAAKIEVAARILDEIASLKLAVHAK